jgi:NAD(P)-dependent dehydrogenase (short-subunit alcohol dehydrogenase family)
MHMATDKSALKTVVITGASTGIGFDTARILLESGEYRLALIGRKRDHLEDAAKTLGHADLVSTFVCDLGDLKQIKPTVEKILATHRKIYGLVNNAGIYPFGGLATTNLEGWDKTFDVNLKAPFLLCQAFAPAMAKSQDGARIINISSTAGILPNHFALAYSVSKAALIHLTKTLAKEVGKDDITVNCICPGIVKTPLHDAYHANKSEMESFYEKRGSTFPLGRVGEPSDISGAVKFFLSKDAAWVTGEVFIADGGRLLI